MNTISQNSDIQSLKNLLDQKDWAGAKLFLLGKSDIPVPLKHYNLGYISAHQDNYVKAVYEFEKAKQTGLYSLELDNALQSTKAHLDILSIESEMTYFDHAILDVKSLSPDVTYSVGLILVLLGLLITVLKKNTLTFLSISVLGALVIAGTFYVNHNYTIGINKVQVAVYNGPSRIFEQVQQLPKGLKIIIKQKSEEWSQVVYPSIYSGWIYKTKVLNL